MEYLDRGTPVSSDTSSEIVTPSSPIRSQPTSLYSSSSQQPIPRLNYPHNLNSKPRHVVCKPSPPPFNQSGRGAKQLAKAIEIKQKQSSYTEVIPLLGNSPIVRHQQELSFVMCYGSTPCFGKVVSNPSSCKSAAGESIMINPYRVNPLYNHLLISWSGVVWLAKRDKVRPVQMTLEPGGYRVVDSQEVREFIDLMASKSQFTYPVSIEQANSKQDTECDMISLDSGSTDTNPSKIDMAWYPVMPSTAASTTTTTTTVTPPVSLSQGKQMKSSPSQGHNYRSIHSTTNHYSSGSYINNSGVAQITPTTTSTSTSFPPKDFNIRPSHSLRPKPKLDVINSSYYLNTRVRDDLPLSQDCFTPKESTISNCNSSSSTGGSQKSVRFVDELIASPITTCVSIDDSPAMTSLHMESPMPVVVVCSEGIAAPLQLFVESPPCLTSSSESDTVVAITPTETLVEVCAFHDCSDEGYGVCDDDVLEPETSLAALVTAIVDDCEAEAVETQLSFSDAVAVCELNNSTIEDNITVISKEEPNKRKRAVGLPPLAPLKNNKRVAVERAFEESTEVTLTTSIEISKTVKSPSKSPELPSRVRSSRASAKPFHRDAIFGTRPSSKQSAATGSWKI